MRNVFDGKRSAERRDRAQLVVVAAAAIALALFPMTLAYLQLGYAGDVATEPTGDPRGEGVERALDRAVHDAVAEVAGEYAWSERDAAANDFRDVLSADLRSVETARVERGVATEVAYAPARANAASTEGSPDSDVSTVCPSGQDRAFGSCEADGGVVLQERAGETAVVAVAFDVRVTRTDGVTELTLLVEVAG